MWRERTRKVMPCPWGTLLSVLLIAIATGTVGAQIINPSFEDGLTGWTGSGFTSATGPETPTDLLRYATASAGPSAPGSAMLSQTFTLPDLAERLFVDLFLVSVNASADAKLILPGDVEVILWQQPGSVSVDGHFRRYSYDVSDYGGQSVTLEFSISAQINQTARADVDRIVIQEMPEPTTAALLLGGALLCGCVGRRRAGRR